MICCRRCVIWSKILLHITVSFWRLKAWKPSDSIPQMGSLQPSSITPFSRKRDYLQGGMQTYVSGTVEQTKLSTLARTGTALGLRSSDGDTEGCEDQISLFVRAGPKLDGVT